jgi:Spherulation-specific family 4
MRRSSWHIALITAPALVTGLVIIAAPAAQAAGESIVTTLYAYPTLPSWGQVEAAAPTVRAAIVDICAPDGSGSGCNGKPADAGNTVWPPTIQALDAAGITPLYYIWTDYGATPLATVESELQNAITWYGVASPMFDGTSASAGEASYYQALYNYAITAGAKTVMFNAGTVVPQSYMFGPAEIMQMFEGTQAQFQAASFPTWMAGYPPSEFSVTIAAGTSAGLATDVSDAQQDGIGNIYVNDEAEPPNYSALPAFWPAEVQDAGGAQGSQAITFPNPGPGVAGQNAALTAAGGASGNPVVFSVDASSGAGVCSVSGTNGSTVSYLAAGTCVIDANQGGGNGYAAAPQIQQAITVSATGTQAITFPNPGPGVVGQNAALTAAGGASGNPVVFSVDASSGAGVCSVSGTNGSTVSYLAAGTCVIDANQGGGNGYAAAPQIQQAITVSTNAATKLAFTTQPGGAADGTAWPAQPAVSVEDASGKVVTGDTSSVTLAIASQPGTGATLTCPANPVTATAGVAAFAGCQITGTAGTYTLQATDGTLTPATSSTFSVSVGAAAQLAFTTQPGGGTSGSAWPAQPAVSVEDSSGNVVTGSTSSVTLAIASQPGTGATLSCRSNPVTAPAGAASFSGCKITGKAGSYTLKATARNLTSATTSTFAITAGPATRLVFTTQPGGGASGSAWPAQPAVAVEDSSGNVVTGSTSPVTLGIASQPGGGAALGCAANPVTASAGVAAFAGCEIAGRSGSYTLKATSSGLSSATSGTFRIGSGSSSASLADVLAHLASG